MLEMWLAEYIEFVVMFRLANMESHLVEVFI
jgi:hypothetical protein